ncbi:MAG: deoxyribose-phosphate aldolase [Prochlorotrichaceae cyanobacterium]|jgi:deoxyribose-phosphate aldolase
MTLSPQTLDCDIDLAPLIDHALLDPAATRDQIDRLCGEADRFHFATVCVSPCYVRRAVENLYQKMPKVCTVIGFPSGASTTATKLYEAQEAVSNGATELDVMINLGLLKSGNTDAVHRELAEICETDRPVKAILELSRLTPAEIQIAVDLSLDAGVRFLKTGTGWAGGATVEEIRLLRELSRGKVGIKAAGGIRTLEQAIALVREGATRLGTSRGVDLMEQRKQ